jgi:hypothetical protein
MVEIIIVGIRWIGFPVVVTVVEDVRPGDGVVASKRLLISSFSSASDTWLFSEETERVVRMAWSEFGKGCRELRREPNAEPMGGPVRVERHSEECARIATDLVRIMEN